MDTRFARVDALDPEPPDPRRRHLVVVGTAGGNADLIADAVGDGYTVELAESDDDVASVLAAPRLVSVAVVDATSATPGVRRLVASLRDRDVPVLLLVAGADPALRRRLGREGGVDVREKPLRRAELRGAVGRLARS